jgi:hypothetical protein
MKDINFVDTLSYMDPGKLHVAQLLGNITYIIYTWLVQMFPTYKSAWCIKQFRPKGVIQVTQTLIYLFSFLTNEHHTSLTNEYNTHRPPTEDFSTITWSATLPCQSWNNLHNTKLLSQNDYELYVSLCINISASLGPTHLLVALLTEYRTVGSPMDHSACRPVQIPNNK